MALREENGLARITPASSGSRIDLRSSSRYGRSDFGVNAARIRDCLSALRPVATSQAWRPTLFAGRSLA
jgi:hypothetical protein